MFENRCTHCKPRLRVSVKPPTQRSNPSPPPGRRSPESSSAPRAPLLCIPPDHPRPVEAQAAVPSPRVVAQRSKRHRPTLCPSIAAPLRQPLPSLSTEQARAHASPYSLPWTQPLPPSDFLPFHFHREHSASSPSTIHRSPSARAWTSLTSSPSHPEPPSSSRSLLRQPRLLPRRADDHLTVDSPPRPPSSTTRTTVRSHIPHCCSHLVG